MFLNSTLLYRRHSISVLCRVRLTAILEVSLRCLVADPVALGFVFSVIGLLCVVPFKGCIGDQCSERGSHCILCPLPVTVGKRSKQN